MEEHQKIENGKKIEIEGILNCLIYTKNGRKKEKSITFKLKINFLKEKQNAKTILHN